MTRKTTLDGVTIPRRFPILFRGERTLVDVHTPGRGFRGASWYLLGWQFGPVAAILAKTYSDAFDEWDEHYGERVDFEADATTLADYATSETIAEAKQERERRGEPDCGDDAARAGLFGAMDCGDVRMNDGGTTVWIDHSEWVEPVSSAARWRTGRTDRG